MSLEQEVIESTNIILETDEKSVLFQHVSQTRLAWFDLKDGLVKWRIWFMLAYQDIKLRYRRSVLGPFWLTLSMAITVYSMGYLYSHLFHIELRKYYPFLVAGMLAWSLVSSAVTELVEAFLASDSLIKQIKLPFTLHIHRIACRNIIIFFHNLLVMVPVLIALYPDTSVNFYTLLFIPGLFIIYVNAISYGLILAMIGSRFRDMSQVVKSLVQVVFFVTPVMWAPGVLKQHNQYVVDLNPFYAFLELIRAPLLGHAPTSTNLLMVAFVSSFGLFVSAKLFIRYRARIIYWL